MGSALVVFATRTGNTKAIASLIAEGIRFTGNQAKVVDIADIKKPEDLEGHDALVLGSPTYHGEMIQTMKTMLFLAEKANLEGKVGAAFGAFGWSGEGLERVYDTMKNVFKMDMVGDPLRLKDPNLGGGIKMAQDYGRSVGEKMEKKSG